MGADTAAVLLALCTGVVYSAWALFTDPADIEGEEHDPRLPITGHGIHRSWDDPIEDVVQAHHDDGHRAVAEAEAWVRSCAADGPYDHETEGL